MTDANNGSRESSPAARPFAVAFDRHAGELLVQGGFLLGAFLLAGAIVRGDVSLLLLALVSGAVGFYHLPAMRSEVPQLSGTPLGLSLDGLGRIPWHCIERVNIREYAVRTIRNAELEIALARPVRECLEPEREQAFPFRNLMMRAWRIENGHTIRVKLEPLRAKPEAVLAAIRRYLE